MKCTNVFPLLLSTFSFIGWHRNMESNVKWRAYAATNYQWANNMRKCYCYVPFTVCCHHYNEHFPITLDLIIISSVILSPCILFFGDFYFLFGSFCFFEFGFGSWDLFLSFILSLAIVGWNHVEWDRFDFNMQNDNCQSRRRIFSIKIWNKIKVNGMQQNQKWNQTQMIQLFVVVHRSSSCQKNVSQIFEMWTYHLFIRDPAHEHM